MTAAPNTEPGGDAMRRVRGGLMAAAAVLAAAGCVHRTAGGDWAVGKTGPGTPAAANATAGPNGEELPGKESAALCLAMAESLDKDGKDADAAGYYERARTLDPALADRAAHRLAILYDRLDEQAKAMAEFHALLKRHPKDGGLLNDIGYSCYNRGQWAEADAYLRRAVAADKGNKRAWVNLGLALAQQGKDAEAVDAFEKAVTPAEARANLGFVLATRGLKADAVGAYRRALELEPTLKIAQAAIARLEAPAAADRPPADGLPGPIQPAAGGGGS